MEEQKPLEINVEDLHTFRQQVDAMIQSAKRMMESRPVKGGREIALVHTKLQEAKMWAGKVLEELGSEMPKELQDKAV